MFQYGDIPLVIGRRYHHFLKLHMAFYAQSKQFHKQVSVHIDIEHHRVVVCLICKENGKRRQHRKRYALSEPHCPHSATRHAVSHIVEDVINNEHKHGYDDGHAESALTYDGTEGRTDEEEQQARERHRKLVYPFNAVHTYNLIAVCRYHPFEVKVGNRRAHLVQGMIHRIKLLFVRKAVVNRVYTESLCRGHLHGTQRIFWRQRACHPRRTAHIPIKRAPYAVVHMGERVDVVPYLRDAFSA